MDFLCRPVKNIQRTTITVPGDKSISHRAVMCGALAHGITVIRGLLISEDTRATIDIFRALGVDIQENRFDCTVHGTAHRLRTPLHDLNCGNSGTAMRLLAGILATQSFSATLRGDASLHMRPMQRVAAPLAQMGARIVLRENEFPPMRIEGGALTGIEYTLPVASAQIKSALLFAGICARGTTTVHGCNGTRDHTERMLRTFGIPIDNRADTVRIASGYTMQATAVHVPGDISSAAFFIVAALITPNASLRIDAVGINPTRTGVIDILRAMGGAITIENMRRYGDEPVADILVAHSDLCGTTIDGTLVTRAIDELPAICIAAACAQGETVIRDAHELRVKESDRIEAVIQGLTAFGVPTHAYPDGLSIHGTTTFAAPEQPIDSHGDHRIAMAFSLLSSRCTAPYLITDCDNVATSFPSFIDCAETVGLSIRTHT